MTNLREHYLETTRAIRAELSDLLEGMDYCLDWKAEPTEWCVREVVYHLLGTPTGGIHSVLQGILSGELTEYELWANQSNITPDRQAKDMNGVLGDIEVLFQGLEQALDSVTDDDLSGKPVVAHIRSRGIYEERNVDVLLERGFFWHWREHLNQIVELRASLGLS